MAQRKDKRKDPNKESIFAEEKKTKVSAKAVLEKAKQQENEKLNSGFAYFASADGKTRVLRKVS